MNRNVEEKARQPSPYSDASIFSKLTYWWLKPIFLIGSKRPIEDDDICAVHKSLQCKRNTDAYSKLWELELKKRNPSILRVMLKSHVYQLIAVGIFFAIGETAAGLIQPICLGGLIDYFAAIGDQTITLAGAYWYATGIVLTTVYTVITYHPFLFYTSNISYKLQVACSGLIYRKSLRISKSASEDGQNGKIINLLSNDLGNFENALYYTYGLWKGPLETIFFSIIIYREIGVAGVIGMAFLLASIPLQGWISKKAGELREKALERTDLRVKVMNEIILGIQVIKMYAWERSFAKMVDQIRRREVSAIRSIAYIQATIQTFISIAKISVLLSIISYILLGNVINARIIFMLSSYYTILEGSMLYLWPVALTTMAETYASIKRLQEFLLKPESKQFNTHFQRFKSKNTSPDEVVVENIEEKAGVDGSTINDSVYTQVVTESSGQRVQNVNSAEKFIRFENTTAVWEVNESHQMNGIFDMNVEIKHGLCAIVGQVGSGKSTLLNVILGELAIDIGEITVNGSISYASQEPWLFGGSVRSNIVFVEEFDAQRYGKVVEVCALEKDLKLLPQGDATIVGEKGITLSGGQKARVNLARAIYRRSDIYLLDDPLSAVDTHVGKHIFERCIEQFLSDKICVLVTHQLQYLKNVNHVIVMQSGKVEVEGPFQKLERFNRDSLAYTEEIEQRTDSRLERLRRQSSTTSGYDEDFEENSNDRKEHKESGSVKLSTHKAYFNAVDSYIYLGVVSVVFIVTQFGYSGINYFFSEWSNWEESVASTNASESNSDSVTQQRQLYMIAYAGIIGVSIFFFFGTFSHVLSDVFTYFN